MFYLHQNDFHQGEDLPVGAVEVPRMPDRWEIWDGAAFVPSLDAVKAFHDEIDEQAEQARASVITIGSGQAMTYLRKEAEARAWLADNNSPVPFVEAEANATSRTIADVAQTIVEQADAWLAVGPRIEAARIAAKRAVSEAGTVAEMQSAASIDWASVMQGNQ